MGATSAIATDTLIDRRYCVQRLLGEGGMGRTYLVADERCFNDLCVVKEFLPPAGDTAVLAKSRELFLREARVLHRLSHPQIPRFLACFEAEERLFLVEEYIDGKNYHVLLEERLARQQQGFSEAEILQWLADILPVLDYIHRAGVIHRDLSPDNIMLPRSEAETPETAHPKPMLIDFGAVKQAMTEVAVGVKSPKTETRTAFVGKVGYAPPEQVRMGQCYPNSDLYAIAVTALVLLTGKPPSELYDSYGMEWQWRDSARVSDALAGIFAKMLAERPQERYASAAEVLAALASVRQMHQSLAVVPRSKTPALAKITTVQNAETAPMRWTAISSLFALSREPNPSKMSTYSGLALSLTGLVAIVATSIVIGMRSPYIPFLCKPLKSCARENEFQQLYARILQQDTTARLLSSPPQNLDDLQKQRARIAETLAQLRGIPEDVSAYTEAQPLLAYYRNELRQIDARLASETAVADRLAAAEKQAQKAERAANLATTPDGVAEARGEWEKAIAQLDDIANESLLSDRVKTLRSEYRAKLSRLEEQNRSAVRQP
ncbi:serine/threonine-protein kinase [Oscillatoria sp. FACHB-1406]|uniref:serine/threonine-protein kinase n=1 Tax=Oscillatoria sp. FACHB-1406 TaxID=2692846 RepID=UPI001683910E|nr:serine/threonine-protein kinase [Oscillatoria sp. FACHB-1406]MBD2577722.1 serine/threonine protein kinase [Oscillatoria sp. FACHB-1406]